uniref:Protein TIC 214 n=1 Tax=Gunnera manicata TaxID=24957 RepID=D3WEA3_9MAGN|nr:putative RF1 protein [Gunnera manicata]
MILKSFLLSNLVSLCMKIINSVVVVGLYYGFLTTFSIGPSYLLLLRAQVMEEGTENKVSATTGFITGQLMMFISIYYAPLHLALGRPHTITVLALPYLLFHFFSNNHKNFFYYGSTSRNSMRNFSIQCVFLNNLIIQLFNLFLLPSSMLARLVNIYMFRCNNKMLFVISSFVGWLIGHILFMKWVGLVLVWIRQNRSIRSNVLKYLVSELRNSMARIVSILLFITCVYYLGRIPSPIFTKKLKETEETDVEIETTSQTKGTKQEQEGSTEEDPSPSLFSEEKEDPDKIDETEEIRVNGKEKTKNEFHFHFIKETCYKNSPVDETYYQEKLWFEKPLVTLLFDYKRWNRPLRYIRTYEFENDVKTLKNEMSQYFFYTCRSNGKERISFMYPPSLSNFFEMIQKKMFLYTKETFLSDERYNHWVYTNEKKRNNLSNEFINRIKALDKRPIFLDIFEKITRLCNNNNKKKYLPKTYDPFLAGPYRGTINKLSSPSILNKRSIKNDIEIASINKIYSILLTDYQEFEQKIDTFDKQSLSKKIGHFLALISKFTKESTSSLNLQGRSEDISNINISFETNEISKKVPLWTHKFITEFEQIERETEESLPVDHEIRSRKVKHAAYVSDPPPNIDFGLNISDEIKGVNVIDFETESDFRRDIIKGSMRAQRRKTVIFKLFQSNAHSPLFLDRTDPLFYFDSFGLTKLISRNRIGKREELKIYNHTEEKTKKTDKDTRKESNEQKIKIEEELKAQISKVVEAQIEDTQLKIMEMWDNIIFGHVIRSCILLIQSILRKYMIFPLLIIIKNIGRILLFQVAEWGEDFADLKKEIHVISNKSGVELSEKEVRITSFLNGIQIKILFPFCLKPWHKYKLPSSDSHKNTTKDENTTKKKKNKVKKDFVMFLTVFGMTAERPFGFPQLEPSFFGPIFNELKKKIFQYKFILMVSNKIKKWVINGILFIKIIIMKGLSQVNPILLFGFIKLKLYESIETKKEKDSIISNQMINYPYIQILSTDQKNYLLTEKQIKDSAEIIRTIKNKIERKDKKIESPKNIWQILKRKNVRVIHKSHYFLKLFIEKIYIDILISIINSIIDIPRINGQLFFELTKKRIDNYIYNKKANQERISKTDNRISFISTIKKSLYNIRKNRKNNSQLFHDLSYLSQAYVFYKLSQNQVSNLSFVLQYHGTSFFLKNEIKDYLRTHGIFHSELQHNKIHNYEMNQWKRNQWKNWLRVHYQHYQYDFSLIRWSRLVIQKRQNKVNQCRTVQNKDLNKWDSYEKDRLIHYEKQNIYEADSLPNIKDNLKKHYIYNLLSYKYLNYEGKKYSYIYESPFKVNKDLDISYNYNTQFFDMLKLFDMLRSIPISNYQIEDDIMHIYKNIYINLDRKYLNPDRKYFGFGILNFCLRNKIDIEAWIDIDTGTNNNKNTKTETTDWFLPEFRQLYNAYKIKPWVLPIKVLFFDFNKKVSENKNIIKKYLGLKNMNEKQKDGEKNYDYAESDIPKLENIKHINIETEPDFLLKKYLLFQLAWYDILRIFNNVKAYYILFRAIEAREISIAYIKNGQVSLDLMRIHDHLTLNELVKKRLLLIDPIRLSINNDRQIIMYQTIGIALVHKNKHQTNQRYRKKGYLDNQNIDEYIASHQRMAGNINKNNYDFLVPENILSSRRRRELRILSCLNSRNSVDRNKVFFNGNNVKNYGQFLYESKHLIKFKIFLWPNYRLEDLACMNRYWFNTNNGSRFSMLRIHMYPRLKIH